jgi:hypothetical protein
VSWVGSDSTSGIATYGVQYRVGAGGTWTTWQAGTSETSATFGPDSPVTVEQKQIYYFRARARDRAGNTGEYAAGSGDCAIYVGGEFVVYMPLVVRDHIPYAAPCGPGNDYCEDHDTLGNSYGPLAPGTGYRAYPDDENDFYYVLLTEPVSATVRVTGYQAVGQLLVYNQDLNTLGMDWNDPGDDGVMTIASLSLDAGKYYIRVYTASGQNTATLYTLTVDY